VAGVSGLKKIVKEGWEASKEEIGKKGHVVCDTINIE